MKNLFRVNVLGGLAALVLAAVMTGVPAAAAQAQGGDQAEPAPTTAQAGRPSVTKAMYRDKNGRLVITGTGFDETAVVRVNGVEVKGERKFRADKNRLRITIPASELSLKGAGQNRLEVIQDGESSGEVTF
jgi:hypothetical protein